jgi:hypothetical protein
MGKSQAHILAEKRSVAGLVRWLWGGWRVCRGICGTCAEHQNCSNENCANQEGASMAKTTAQDYTAIMHAAHI